MRGRLLTNGILSSIGITLFIIVVSLSVEMHNLNSSINGVPIKQWDYVNTVNVDNLYIAYVVMLTLMIFVNIATFVMGIITLSMNKNNNARGLTIASGVLGILSGMLGAGVIVSFIGFAKAK